MPKRTTTNTPSTPAAQAGPGALRFLTGIGAIVLASLLFIALGAFCATGAKDRSIFDLPFVELLTSDDIEVHNPLGKLGAWVADLLMTNGVGLMAFALPWLIVVTGLRILGVKGLSLKSQIVWSLGITIWGSIALGFAMHRAPDRFYLLLGGIHGHVVSGWLMNAIGAVGTFALLASILFAVVATKSPKLRAAIINLLASIHINIPHIDLTPDEGHPITPAEEDGQGDAAPHSNSEGGGEDDDTSSGEGDAPATAAATGGMQITYAQGDPEVAEGGDASPDTTDAAAGEQTATQDNGSGNAADAPSGDFQITRSDEGDAGDLDTAYDPRLDLSHYNFPTTDLLIDYSDRNQQLSEEELMRNKDKIVSTLENFQIRIDSIKATVGPTVTLYEVVPAPGIRVAKIASLSDDIALSLAASGIRIIAPIPGQGTVGIEVPNSTPQIVGMRSVLRSARFQNFKGELPVALGKTISGETYVFDLAKTPHLLVAGATGQGKSVGLNAIISSILYKKHPAEVKFVLVDPKMVEFSMYKRLECHYLAKMESEDAPVITDTDKVKNTLQSLTIEMDARYALLEKAGVRDVREYNERFIARRLNPEKGHRYMPYIVLIIDEFGDLIMTAGKEIEQPIARIAQKARAVGIHMILATQRPSTNIITGVIKSNFPSRMAFKVASMVDSRTILDQSGAQHLIGRGDMLMCMAGNRDPLPMRLQCAYIETDEVERLVDFISAQQGYAGAYPLPEVNLEGGAAGPDGEGGAKPGKFDDKIREVAKMVVNTQIGSTSNIQRTFEVGYNRAGKLMDQLERLGIVGPIDGSKPRQVYVATEADLERILQAFGL